MTVKTYVEERGENRIDAKGFFSQGFYTVYRQLFKDIAEQDIKASSDKTIEIPEFGNSEGDYDEVRYQLNSLRLILLV